MEAEIVNSKKMEKQKVKAVNITHIGHYKFVNLHEWKPVPIGDTQVLIDYVVPSDRQVLFIDDIGNNWQDSSLYFLEVDGQMMPLYAELGGLNFHRLFVPPLVIQKSLKYWVFNGSNDGGFVYECQVNGRLKEIK